MPPRSAKKNAAVAAAVKKTPAKAKQTPKVQAEKLTELNQDPNVAEEQTEVKHSVEFNEVKVDEQKPEADENIKDEKSQLNDDEHDPGNQDGEEPVKEEATNMVTNEDVAEEDAVEEEDEKTPNEEDEAVQAIEEEDGGEEEDVMEDEEGPEGGEGDENDQQVNDVPAPLKDRRKQKEFEIFVGGLDKDADEEDLKKVFGEVGEIVEVRMSKNHTTHKNKGFAFIRYATVEEAKRALTELKNPQVREKQCGVSASQDNDTLYVGNICKTWTKEAVKEKLKEYGVENIVEMVLMDDSKNDGQNRGYVFLEFETHQDAINAYRRLQKPDAVFGCEKSAKVAFAESSIRIDEEVMAQVKTVFLDALPESWNDERVKEELKKYGEIEKVQLSRNMSSAKRKDYGFVSFVARENALACVEGVNSSDLGDGDNKIKANIAKPQHKSRLVKKGVRGGFRLGDTGNKSKKGPKRFKSKGFRGSVNRFRGKDTSGKKDKAAETKDASKGNAIKDVGQKRKRDNERKEKGNQNPSFRQDRNRSRRISQSGRVPWLSRSVPYSRDSYPKDSYTRHLELVNSYTNDVRQPYGATAGSKRSYSALDDVPRYSEPALRLSRPRLDYDVGSASLYGGRSYEESMRLGRAAEEGYSVHPRSSYGIYDSEIGYNRSSIAGAGVGGVYSSGYASTSIPGRVNSVGSSYSSLYPTHRPGTGYLPGRGSGAYY